MSGTIPAAELPTEIAELAAKVAALPESKKISFPNSYYLVNINHPVSLELRTRFCTKYDINPHYPMSDVERISFELMLFRPDVLNMIKDFCEKQEKKDRSESDAP